MPRFKFVYFFTDAQTIWLTKKHHRYVVCEHTWFWVNCNCDFFSLFVRLANTNFFMLRICDKSWRLKICINLKMIAHKRIIKFCCLRLCYRSLCSIDIKHKWGFPPPISNEIHVDNNQNCYFSLHLIHVRSLYYISEEARR